MRTRKIIIYASNGAALIGRICLDCLTAHPDGKCAHGSAISNCMGIGVVFARKVRRSNEPPLSNPYLPSLRLRCTRSAMHLDPSPNLVRRRNSLPTPT